MNSFKTIAQKMDPVESPNSLRELIRMHRWAPSENRSFRTICNRHNHLSKKERRFLCWNTFLMDVWIGSTGGRIFLGIITGGISEVFADPEKAKKPAVNDRAPKIGRAISNYFDFALLSEIYEDNVLQKVLSVWPDDDLPHFVEDSQWESGASSGLVSISKRDRITDSKIHRYKFKSGNDSHARKGVLFTCVELNLGRSKLELYNTHMNAGDDSARRYQVLELVSFIQLTHKENNIAILAGDFNIDAHDEKIYTDSPYRPLPLPPPRFGANGRFVPQPPYEDFSDPRLDTIINPRFPNFIEEKLSSDEYPDGMSEYEALVELLDLIGFKDIWPERNGSLGYTSGLELVREGIPELICPVDERDTSDDKTPSYCSDIIDTIDRGDVGRIDHIFLNNPEDNHTFSLDFTRPRRLRSPRRDDAPELHKISFLSDHLGLATTLIISPK